MANEGIINTIPHNLSPEIKTTIWNSSKQIPINKKYPMTNQLPIKIRSPR